MVFNSRKFIIIISQWLISMAIALVIGTGVCEFYNSCIGYSEPLYGATDTAWRPNYHMNKMTEGIAFNKTDCNGYNNSEIPDKVDILVMGGSHMEAMQIPARYNTASLLQEYTHMDVYNIGMAHHWLDICLDNLGRAIDGYHPKYVVLQTADLDIGNDALDAVYNGTRERLILSNYRMPSFIRLNPLAVHLATQISGKTGDIDVIANRFRASAEDSGTENADEGEEIDQELYREVLKNASDICKERDVKLILVYTPSIDFDGETGLYRTDNTDVVSAVNEICKDCDITLIDSMADFASAYSESYILPYGFYNTEIGKGHLNKAGHAIVAGEIKDAIEAEEVGR